MRSNGGAWYCSELRLKNGFVRFAAGGAARAADAMRSKRTIRFMRRSEYRLARAQTRDLGRAGRAMCLFLSKSVREWDEAGCPLKRFSFFHHYFCESVKKENGDEAQLSVSLRNSRPACRRDPRLLAESQSSGAGGCGAAAAAAAIQRRDGRVQGPGHGTLCAGHGGAVVERIGECAEHVAGRTRRSPGSRRRSHGRSARPLPTGDDRDDERGRQRDGRVRTARAPEKGLTPCTENSLHSHSSPACCSRRERPTPSLRSRSSTSMDRARTSTTTCRSRRTAAIPRRLSGRRGSMHSVTPRSSGAAC